MVNIMSVTYFAPKRKTLGPNSSICFTLATEKTTSAKLAISELGDAVIKIKEIPR